MATLLEDALVSPENEFLLTRTMGDIKDEISDILDDFNLSRENYDIYANKLKNYIYIDEFGHLKYGHYIRWILYNDVEGDDEIDPQLKIGGFVTEINITDIGVNVVCKTALGRFVTVAFNEAAVFMKLRDIELAILDIMASSDV